MSDDMTVETVSVPTEWVGTRSGSRVARVTIDGESLHLTIPKGTRGVKVGAALDVRIEYRDWFQLRRVTASLREGTVSESTERAKYHDGAIHAHHCVVGVAKAG